MTAPFILLQFKCLFIHHCELTPFPCLWSLSFSGSCDLTPCSCRVCSIAGECMNHTLKTKTEGNKANRFPLIHIRYFKILLFAHKLQFSSLSFMPDLQFGNTGFLVSCLDWMSCFSFQLHTRHFPGQLCAIYPYPHDTGCKLTELNVSSGLLKTLSETNLENYSENKCCL